MRKSRSGFTIVELIVVIVVIAVLATISAVAYTGAQASARDTKRKTDLADISEAIQLYRQKYNNEVTTATVKTYDASGNPTGTVVATCGAAPQGNYWFNYSTGSQLNPGPAGNYQSSTLKCLQDNGYLDGGGTFVDPSGCSTTSGSTQGVGGTCQKYGNAYSTYMKFSSGSGTDSSLTCLYARLENEDHTADLLSPSNPCYGLSSVLAAKSYGMNYELLVK